MAIVRNPNTALEPEGSRTAEGEAHSDGERTIR